MSIADFQAPSAQRRLDDEKNSLWEILRRDWAVRVLVACEEHGIHAGLVRYGCHSKAWWHGPVQYKDADAARLAAAEAVWSELPESVRAELGERP